MLSPSMRTLAADSTRRLSIASFLLNVFDFSGISGMWSRKTLFYLRPDVAKWWSDQLVLSFISYIVGNKKFFFFFFFFL